MIRDVDVREISDGRFYGPNDMVRADTGSCAGCSKCCHGMCDTILLDPLDVFRLIRETGKNFEALMQGDIRLRVADGLILPHLADTGEDERCVYLDEKGRCTVHGARPGLCRLYPLGRYYQGEDFVYILQIKECDHPRTKVKVKRWLDTPELGRYEAYVRTWHGFIRAAAKLADADESIRKGICMEVLRHFYRREWEVTQDFYPQFEAALKAARAKIGLAGGGVCD